MTPLVRSIYDNDLQGIKAAMDRGEDPNAENYVQCNALNVLCMLNKSNDHFDCIFDLLIARGADPLHKRRKDNIPLHWVAAEFGNLRACERLYAFIPKDRISEFTTSESGASSLYVAAQNGHARTVHLLLFCQHFDANNTSSSGMTILISACADPKKHDDEEAVLAIRNDLLAAGADPFKEFQGKNVIELIPLRYSRLLFEWIKYFIIQGRFELTRYKSDVKRLNKRHKRFLLKFVQRSLSIERNLFAAFFNGTCDDETSFQTEVFGPVAEELASTGVFPLSATRKALRDLEHFFA